MTLTAWHSAEMDSAHKNQLEPTYKVLLLKNAYHIVFQGELSIFMTNLFETFHR